MYKCCQAETTESLSIIQRSVAAKLNSEWEEGGGGGQDCFDSGLISDSVELEQTCFFDHS